MAQERGWYEIVEVYGRLPAEFSVIIFFFVYDMRSLVLFVFFLSASGLAAVLPHTAVCPQGGEY